MTSLSADPFTHTRIIGMIYKYIYNGYPVHKRNKFQIINALSTESAPLSTDSKLDDQSDGLLYFITYKI